MVCRAPLRPSDQRKWRLSVRCHLLDGRSGCIAVQHLLIPHGTGALAPQPTIEGLAERSDFDSMITLSNVTESPAELVQMRPRSIVARVRDAISTTVILGHCVVRTGCTVAARPFMARPGLVAIVASAMRRGLIVDSKFARWIH
jgi:hypothetical protein